MNNDIKSVFAQKVGDFRFPRYSELPNVGLYLEQITKYTNGILAPLGVAELTPSMISNYVKKGLVDSPVKKLYYAEHLAYILFVGVVKSVMAIDDISYLYSLQKTIYPCDVAYDYFCMEFENMLACIAGIKEKADDVGVTSTELKTALRSVIICAANHVFVSNSLAEFRKKEE
ncbi:MAG: DUF1836 domain-containing protein [Ruminococcaceae bacterium]|nr:DUF1836 domain-containing protein [Oscillospiraceae bacterium]